MKIIIVENNFLISFIFPDIGGRNNQSKQYLYYLFLPNMPKEYTIYLSILYVY